MRDVIQRVIATEAEAKCIVEAARVEGARILAEAQKRSQDIATRARQEAQIEAKRMVEAAVSEAGREKQERLARAAAEIETQVRLEETTKQRAVEASIRCVCEPRQPREERSCHE